MATIADLTGETISSSYGTLLMVTDTAGITSSLQTVQDGLGAGSSALKLSTTVVSTTGSLGVGMDTPRTNLEVFDSTAAGLTIHTDSNTATHHADLLFKVVGGNTADEYRKAGVIFENDGSGSGVGNLHFCVDGVADSNNVTLTDSKMQIDPSGNVGIGGTAGNKLHVICDDDDGIRISAGTAAAHGDKNARIYALNTAGTYYNDLELRASETRIYSDGTPTMTIDSSGNVGIGADMAAATDPVGKLVVSTGDLVLESGVTVNGNADELVIQNDAAAGISILTPNSNSGWLIFGDTDSSNEGMIAYDHGGSLTGSPGADSMLFYTDGSSRMTIDSSGDVSIASGKLTLGAGATDGYLYLSGDSDQYIKGDEGSNWMALFTANAERMRIDSSGNVLCGGITGSSGYGELETTTFTTEGQCVLNHAGSGNVIMMNLPTADPAVAGALYSDGATSAGVPKALMISGG